MEYGQDFLPPQFLGLGQEAALVQWKEMYHSPGQKHLTLPRSILLQSPLDSVSRVSFAGGGGEGAYIFLAAVCYESNHTINA